LILRPLLKSTIAGLTMLGLMLQACLVALQLSAFVAPATGAFDQALNVICTSHGAVVPAADQMPSERRSDCALCPLCWHVGPGNLVVLPNSSIETVLMPPRALVFEFSHDVELANFVAHPRSRGPPASA
jgi:hypothetical protein